MKIAHDSIGEKRLLRFEGSEGQMQGSGQSPVDENEGYERGLTADPAYQKLLEYYDHVSMHFGDHLIVLMKELEKMNVNVSTTDNPNKDDFKNKKTISFKGAAGETSYNPFDALKQNYSTFRASLHESNKAFQVNKQEYENSLREMEQIFTELESKVNAGGVQKVVPWDQQTYRYWSGINLKRKALLGREWKTATDRKAFLYLPEKWTLERYGKTVPSEDISESRRRFAVSPIQTGTDSQFIVRIPGNEIDPKNTAEPLLVPASLEVSDQGVVKLQLNTAAAFKPQKQTENVAPEPPAKEKEQIPPPPDAKDAVSAELPAQAPGTKEDVPVSPKPKQKDEPETADRKNSDGSSMTSTATEPIVDSGKAEKESANRSDAPKPFIPNLLGRKIETSAAFEAEVDRFRRENFFQNVTSQGVDGNFQEVSQGMRNFYQLYYNLSSDERQALKDVTLVINPSGTTSAFDPSSGKLSLDIAGSPENVESEVKKNLGKPVLRTSLRREIFPVTVRDIQFDTTEISPEETKGVVLKIKAVIARLPAGARESLPAYTLRLARTAASQDPTSNVLTIDFQKSEDDIYRTLLFDLTGADPTEAPERIEAKIQNKKTMIAEADKLVGAYVKSILFDDQIKTDFEKISQGILRFPEVVSQLTQPERDALREDSEITILPISAESAGAIGNININMTDPDEKILGVLRENLQHSVFYRELNRKVEPLRINSSLSEDRKIWQEDPQGIADKINEAMQSLSQDQQRKIYRFEMGLGEKNLKNLTRGNLLMIDANSRPEEIRDFLLSVVNEKI